MTGPDGPFLVGQKVWCILRQQEATVVDVCPGGVAGVLGTVRVRYGDGSEVTQASDASSLEPCPEPADGPPPP